MRGSGDLSLSARKGGRSRTRKITIVAVVAAMLFVVSMSGSALANTASLLAFDEPPSDILIGTDPQTENGDIRPLDLGESLGDTATMELPFTATMYGWPPDTEDPLNFTYTIELADGNTGDGCSIPEGNKTISFSAGENINTIESSFELQFTNEGTYSFVISQAAPAGIADSVVIDKRTYTFPWR